MDKLDEAKPYFENAVAIYSRIYGPEHPNLASLLNNLAGLLRNQVLLTSFLWSACFCGIACDTFVTICSSRKMRSMCECPPAQSGNLFSQGKYAQAVELYKRSLAIRVKVLGPEHPIAAESLNNLAIVLSDMGELEEAERMSKRCLVIAKSHYHVDHPEFVNYRGNYGIVLKAMGKKQEARKCMEEVLPDFNGCGYNAVPPTLSHDAFCTFRFTAGSPDVHALSNDISGTLPVTCDSTYC